MSGLSIPFLHTTTTFTGELGPGLLLRIGIDEDNYTVTDFIGTRFGHAPVLDDALTGWSEQVDDILGLDGPLGDPIKSEVAAYRKALGL